MSASRAVTLSRKLHPPIMNGCSDSCRYRRHLKKIHLWKSLPEKTGRLPMRSEQPVRCAKCYLRMESYELRIVHRKRTYHQHCFLMLARQNQKKDERGAGLVDTR